MARKAEYDVDTTGVFNKLFPVATKVAGKLDCMLYRAQIQTKEILVNPFYLSIYLSEDNIFKAMFYFSYSQ